MIFFILAIIVFVCGIIGGIAYAASEDEMGKFFIPSGICTLIAAVLLVISLFGVVPAGYTGILVTFGKVEDTTLDSGAHMVAPWSDVITMDNRVQKQSVELPCFSSDIQEVNMRYTVNYQISKADAMTIYRTIGTDYYNTIIAPNIAEAVKIATAKHTAEDLISARESLAAEIEAILIEKLTEYNIEVVGTSIEDMDFTDVFTNAVEAKQVAQQNKLRAQTEAEQKVIESEAAAEVRKINADAEAYELLTKAEAEAEANRKLSESLTDNLINYTYAQTWDGKLPYITSSNGVIVNAQDIMNNAN